MHCYVNLTSQCLLKLTKLLKVNLKIKNQTHIRNISLAHKYQGHCIRTFNYATNANIRD